MITKRLAKRVMRDATIHFDGIHGPGHWARVIGNAERICEVEGIPKKIPMLFGLLHDCQRLDDSHDKGHGHRAAQYAAAIRGALPPLSDAEFKRLVYALKWHDDRVHSRDKVVGACWDADRLDLTRCGVIPDPEMLNTDAARSMAMQIALLVAERR